MLKSQKLPGDGQKNLAELEFEDITAEDKGAMLRYAVFYQQRQLRKQRLQPPAAPR